MAPCPWHIGVIFDDIDDSCWAYELLVCEIVDGHAPRNKNLLKGTYPFMSSDRLEDDLQKRRFYLISETNIKGQQIQKTTANKGILLLKIRVQCKFKVI